MQTQTPNQLIPRYLARRWLLGTLIVLLLSLATLYTAHLWIRQNAPDQVQALAEIAELRAEQPVRIDRDEILVAAHSENWWLASVGLLLVLVTLLAALTLWWRYVSNEIQAQFLDERRRRKMSEALRQSEIPLATFFKESSIGMAIVSPDGHWVRFNRKLIDMLGYRASELELINPAALIHPDDLATNQARFEELRSGDRDFHRLDARLIRKDSECLHVQQTMQAVHRANGDLDFVLLQITDLSDRYHVDALYTALVDSSIDGFCVVDSRNGRLLEINAAYCRMLGWSRPELLNMTIFDLAAVIPASENVNDGGSIITPDSTRFETCQRTKDGETINVEISTNVSDFAGGRIYAFVRDITERKRIETTLAEEREQLNSLFDGVDAVIYVADPETYELIYVNEAFRRRWGSSPPGQKCYQALQNRDSPCPFCTNQYIFGEHLGTTHVWDFQNEVTGFWFRCADKAIRWPDGRWVRFELALDITEQKLVSDQRAQLEKFGALGRLTAGIAHELNNPLMGIINGVQFCLESLEPEHECLEVLSDTEHATRRCINIVQNLLAFSHSSPNGRQDRVGWDPVPVIERVLRLLDYRIQKENVEVTTSFTPSLCLDSLQPEPFEQVLINLLSNALDALADSVVKKIHISTLESAENFELHVADNGPGIDPQQRDRIFDPFYTTKPTGKGTGLGLSTSWSLVTAVQGHIEVLSREGRGTTMIIKIPIKSPEV